MAEMLKGWLPTVLAGGVECFVSSQDIRRGERGMDVIANELQNRDYGIVVLTRENLKSPWVNFEAGALGKSLGVGRVAPLLLDITSADVEGPLSQFQSTLLSDRDDVRQFLRDLNGLTTSVPEESIDAIFDAKWGDLEAVVARAGGEAPKTARSVESMLEEVLGHVRLLSSPAKASPPSGDDEARKMRLDQLENSRGSKIFFARGRSMDVWDYNHAAGTVLVDLDGSGGPLTWVRVSEGYISPF
ncbi:hypothetical protein BO218_03570 [Microbacterium paludicola]|nr:hypothetical protein BO218_03570 [Microbacterium paludicola]